MIPRTSQDVKKEFERKGISVASWARANGFETNLVFEVLSGRKKGVRGQSHKIAVKLGLKAGEIIEDHDIATAINM
ncbi:phage-associated protein, BcepMu gp16 family [Humidesulfovibrio mexicanus]|uniref:Phage-associated protein, BcepMu gp16 family n=1 Tax=Humidesulfovibrio mexicanus TaxID=147047 RepID=A0A239BEC3_9BACT|nr:DNA-binding protein [Humidesulfovibrio mexicanus]SNS05972.1 phage-associated protein, BcepMu gp16 family [Humidesulfovibrio mexicanus]